MLNIMVLDDDRFQLHAAVKVIESCMNCSVYPVSSGVQAMALLHEMKHFDIVFCDLNMPEMDGVEFIQGLAGKDLVTNVVVMSAVSSEILSSVEEMATLYGFDNAVTCAKPLTEEKVSQVLAITHGDLADKTSVCDDDINLSEEEVEHAVLSGQMEGYIQPHISAHDSTIVGGEVLVRWIHPEYGLIPPGYFLNRISSSATKYALTKSMFLTAARVVRSARGVGRNIQVSVNVEISDLLNPTFVDFVSNVLEFDEIPAGSIVIEVTEREFTDKTGPLLSVLSRLRLRNFGISIDDFGTGNSSLIQLVSGPFNQLKIDRYFVDKMTTSTKHHLAVESTIDMAKKLNIDVVAEGVENQHQADALIQMGANLLQGYFYSPAIPTSAFLDMINAPSKIAMN